MEYADLRHIHNVHKLGIADENIQSIERMKNFLPFALSVVAIALACLFLFVSANRDLTPLESAFFQLVILASSFLGSYFIGRREARIIANDIVTAHARPAFRRLMSLYKSISRVATVSSRNSDINDDATSLKIVRAIVDAQIDTADDALEDWKDLCPELVKEAKAYIQNGERRREVDE